MTRTLHNLELKRVFQIMVAVVILLLVAITALGAKQYFLYQHCREAVSLSDKLLFGFTSIKEHINETLLTGGQVDISEISKEIQGFDEQIKRIGDDILIPEEFKASFIAQVNLVSLVVQLRAVQSRQQASTQQLSDLTTSLSSVSQRLLQFHEVLSAYTQSLLLGLHRVMVGTMALVVFIVCFMMFFMHRYISEPILRLHRLVTTVAGGDETGQGSHAVKATVADLGQLVQETAGEKQRLNNLLVSLTSVRDTLPDTMDDPEFWETLCQALQTNPDYLLVWVGRPAGDDEYPRPVTGCGCVSSAPAQCKQAISHLITYCRQDGSLCDSARQAAAGKRIVIDTTPVMQMPDSLRTSLPFERKTLLCASFPVLQGEKLLAVVTLYSPTPRCFGRSETEILDFFFRQIGTTAENDVRRRAAVKADVSAGGYRYSVIGALAAGLAHEMTNSTNGALNYSQALLDLMADESSLGAERQLLEKLHQEEVKNAGLTGELTRLVDSSDSTLEKIQLPLLLERAVRLLRGQFKQDGIKVVVDSADDLPAVSVPVQSVLILLLTLLHRSADFINEQSHGAAQKMITVVIQQDDTLKKLLLSIDNCPADQESMQSARDDESPWPDLSACSGILQPLGGTLETGEHSRSSGDNQCTLSFPIS